VCNVCSGSVRFILPRDPAARFRFASLQSPAAERLLTACGRRPATLDTLVLIDDDGRCYERSDAVLRIAGSLPFPWKLASGLSVIPRPIRDGLYKFFAARRYRWFGRKDVCELPPAGWRERFLD
jgi:predicted DCC family thiol-disulfide oxidoreductase YuxK